MKPEEFCYWLQGYFELSEAKAMSAKQVAMVKAHLALVFEHAIDPSYLEGLPEKEAAEKKEHLQKIHDQGKLQKDLSPVSPGSAFPPHSPFPGVTYRC